MSKGRSKDTSMPSPSAQLWVTIGGIQLFDKAVVGDWLFTTTGADVSGRSTSKKHYWL